LFDMKNKKFKDGSDRRMRSAARGLFRLPVSYKSLFKIPVAVSAGLVLLLISFALAVEAAAGEQGQSPFEWPVVTAESRPWTRWWWHGSAVTKEELTRHFELFAAAGLGGVEITPIYGVRGNEENDIDFLSVEWMNMLGHAVKEARRLGMDVDMATGTGWPFGGPQVTPEYAAKKIDIRVTDVSPGDVFKKKFTSGFPAAVMAFSDSGRAVDLSAGIDREGNLAWNVPGGEWKIYAAFVTGTGQKVKRAAPGGEGLVLDHYSMKALEHYLERFEKAFSDSGAPVVRAFFNDSFEVYGAEWTENFFGEFAKRRGYDLREYINAFAGDGDADTVARVRTDYNETIGEMLLENFTVAWTQWAHEMGAVTRNQAHGSPGNLLDLYAAVDIPETESFGPGGFNIPGLRTEEGMAERFGRPDPLAYKFAASAAHLSGRRLVSSESCTWLGEHFRVALSQVKPELDSLFTGGVNHVFYHGTAYSPENAKWPGWLFYAPVNFGPTNTFWDFFSELNGYVARTQAFLQSGAPGNDILLYWPVHDLWRGNAVEADGGMLDRFSVHNAGSWLRTSAFGKVAESMWNQGYSFDYTSDDLLDRLDVRGDILVVGRSEYRAVVVPPVGVMPVSTVEKLVDLAGQGATVCFVNTLPADVPGLFKLERRRERLENALAGIGSPGQLITELFVKETGSGRMMSGNLEELLEEAGAAREPAMEAGIRFLRRKHGEGYIYFFTNLGGEKFDGWLELGTKAVSAIIYDTLRENAGLAAVRRTGEGKTDVYLQLDPGESLILETFDSKEARKEPWKYVFRAGEPFVVKGDWRIEFVKGGPKRPGNLQAEEPLPWTEIGGEKARIFSGTARYTVEFEAPENFRDFDDWQIDLGDVREAARVWINGRPAGAAWCLPFSLPVGSLLERGLNRLEIEVANLPANRIAYLDRKMAPWKKFKDANIVDKNYMWFNASGWEPVASGLTGVVKLLPVEFKTGGGL